MKQISGLCKLPLELRERIYENLFSEGEILHIPEPERSSLAALACSSKSVCNELQKWQAARKKLSSIKKRYTMCTFTVSPDIRRTAPASPQDWPHIKDVDITVDGVALEKSYKKNWAKNRELVIRQVADMKKNLESFVAWASARNTPLTSVRIRLKQDEDALVPKEHILLPKKIANIPKEVLHCAPIMVHLLDPLLKFPPCANTVVEQTEHDQDRMSGVDGGLDRVDDLGYDCQIGFKFALQGWLKLDLEKRRANSFDVMLEDLAEVEWREGDVNKELFRQV